MSLEAGPHEGPDDRTYWFSNGGNLFNFFDVREPMISSEHAALMADGGTPPAHLYRTEPSYEQKQAEIQTENERLAKTMQRLGKLPLNSSGQPGPLERRPAA